MTPNKRLQIKMTNKVTDMMGREIVPSCYIVFPSYKHQPRKQLQLKLGRVTKVKSFSTHEGIWVACLNIDKFGKPYITNETQLFPDQILIVDAESIPDDWYFLLRDKTQDMILAGQITNV